jgi:DNA-directed RNA polymerase specialized sigma24 family protein
VIVLHYYLDLSLPETATALGIPLGTAKSRLGRALDAMRVAIAESDAPGPTIAQGRLA